MSTEVIVVGGGFNGIYAAWSLAQAGVNVVLVERANYLGGVMWSSEWRNFRIDLGAQVLDLRVPKAERFYQDILGNHLKILDSFIGGSATLRHTTRQIEYPDFSDDALFCTAAIQELQSSLGTLPSSDEKNYADYLLNRYGALLGGRMARIARKLTTEPAEDLAAGAARSLPTLERAKLGSDSRMVDLKSSSSSFDERLAVTASCGVPAFLGRNALPKYGYTDAGGFQTFCVSAERRLQSLGVRLELGTSVERLSTGSRSAEIYLSTGEKLEAESVAWTLSEAHLTALLGLEAPQVNSTALVGLDLHLLEVSAADINGPDYLNNFLDTHVASRFSAGGIYSSQVNQNGRTFVTAEVPVGQNPGQSTASADTIWAEMQSVGFMRKGATWHAHAVLSFPSVYRFERPLNARIERRRIEVADRPARVVLCQARTRGRLDFMEEFDERFLDSLLIV